MAYPSGPPAAAAAPPLGSTNTLFRTETRLDLAYVATPPGVLKAVLLVLNVLAAACVGGSAFRSHSRGVFCALVALLGLAFSAALLLAYLYHVVEKYHNFKWLKVEMAGSVLLTFLNLVAATLAVAFGDAGYSAAGFFGYLAMVAYGAAAALAARALKAGRPAQGARVRSAAPHVVAAPPAPA